MDVKDLSPQPETGPMRFHTSKHLTFPFALLEDRIQRMPAGNEYEIISDVMPDHGTRNHGVIFRPLRRQATT